MSYILLQQYWWAIVALLASLLVFLLFVQGGQSLLTQIGRNQTGKRMIINCLGRKWEITFTTLVTFGGAFFASFPLFYSTSFGGAYYVWIAILLVFVIQAVSYEFRGKAGNVFGTKGYDTFLAINGFLAPLLIGTAVGTFFTGADFTVDLSRIGSLTAGENVISQWASPWRGLEAVADARNVALGLAVLFLARALGAQYFMNSIASEDIYARSRASLMISAPAFVLFFLTFLFTAAIGIFFEPIFLILLLVGVVLVLWGFYKGIFVKNSTSGIWFTGIGTVVAVFSLLLFVGYTGPYYPSNVDPLSSLTIYNSSSSAFTLSVMSWVSLAIPLVVAYIWWAWWSMNRKKITQEEIEDKNEDLY
ncbi:MAG: cytochrome d ubiquinol oxidase subunit II [Mucinivorans sp.]